MKTPEEIKKGLAHCSGDAETCDGCPYRKEGDYEDLCVDVSQTDALAYIIQLEQRLAQAERERDAAVVDLSNSCQYCKFASAAVDEAQCASCIKLKNAWLFSPSLRTKFEWRGVCEENSR